MYNFCTFMGYEISAIFHNNIINQLNHSPKLIPNAHNMVGSIWLSSVNILLLIIIILGLIRVKQFNWV